MEQAGLQVRARNYAGDEPLSLAANRGVDQFLRSKLPFHEARFGHGNAYDEMAEDESQVTEVTWYTVPLPGKVALVGGRHSFLVIAVSEADKPVNSYLLEKAGSVAAAAHQKNGIFVGSQDLGNNLLSVEGVSTFGQLALGEGSLKDGLKMMELHEAADRTGPYDLASSNGHRAAQQVFNHCCARAGDQELQLPNKWLAKSALHLATRWGVQLWLLKSEVGSAKSESASCGKRWMPRPASQH